MKLAEFLTHMVKTALFLGALSIFKIKMLKYSHSSSGHSVNLIFISFSAAWRSQPNTNGKISQYTDLLHCHPTQQSSIQYKQITLGKWKGSAVRTKLDLLTHIFTDPCIPSFFGCSRTHNFVRHWNLAFNIQLACYFLVLAWEDSNICLTSSNKHLSETHGTGFMSHWKMHTGNINIRISGIGLI
jgi:hypothetical protein